VFVLYNWVHQVSMHISLLLLYPLDGSFPYQ
jgi:hypothetical protein